MFFLVVFFRIFTSIILTKLQLIFMKKSLLFFIVFFVALPKFYSQINSVSKLSQTSNSSLSKIGNSVGEINKSMNIWTVPPDGSYTYTTRIPGNTYGYQRTEYLILASEIAASGFSAGLTIDAIMYKVYSAGVGTLTGTLKVYMKNTNDNSYTLGTNWSLNGFTQVCNNTSFKVPIEEGEYTIPFVGGSQFVYTGGGVYVAWEFSSNEQIGTTPLIGCCNVSTTYYCCANRSNGFLSLNLTPTNLRPATKFVNESLVDIAEITNIYAPEKLALIYGMPATIGVRVVNNSSASSTFDVDLSIKDQTNSIILYSNSQTVTDLNAGQSTIVYFPGISLTTAEIVNINATTSVIPNENFTGNNTKSCQASVNANTMGYSLASSTANVYTAWPSGIMCSKFFMNTSGVVSGANLLISNTSDAVGTSIYAVLLNSAGTIVAQSQSYSIQYSDLSTYKHFEFEGSPTFTNENYYVGMAQPSGFSYNQPLGAFAENPRRPGTFYKGSINGGLLTEIGSGENIKFGIEAVVTFSSLCPVPYALNATVITTNSANLKWTAGAFESSWEYAFGVAPFTAPSGTGIVTNSNLNNLISGLTPSTTYQYFVRANCGNGIFSSWTGPYTFHTLCSPVSIPYSENFDGTVAPNLPYCASVENVNGDINTWQVSSTVSNSGPNSLFILYNSTQSMDDWFFSAPLSLNPGKYRVVFKYRNSGLDYREKLEVNWGNSPTSSAMTNGLIFSNTNIGQAYFVEGSGFFTVTTAGVYYVGWHGFSNPDMHFISIDDIAIDPAQDCMQPFYLCAANITQTSATLSWIPEGNETSWNIEYGPEYLALGTGTTISGLTSTHYNLSGLTPNTNYQFYVQANCGGQDGSSIWSGPYSFSTSCFAVQAPIYEDFEVVPLCWSIQSPIEQNWGLSNQVSANGVGTQSLYARFYTFNNDTPFYVFTPEFSTTNLVNPYLSFDYAYQTYQNEVDQLNVLYSTDGGANYQLLQTYLGGINGDLNTAGAGTSEFVPTNADWNNITLFLPPGTNRIALEAISAFGNNLYIDNFKIDGNIIHKSLVIKTLLEGLYDYTNPGHMRKAQGLLTDDVIGDQFPGDVADKVTVKLVATQAPFQTAYEFDDVEISTSGIINISNLPGNINGSYYVVLKHRNCVLVCSAEPINFNLNGPFALDFSQHPENVYGSNLKDLLDGYFAIYSGDVNHDGGVGVIDIGLVENQASMFGMGYLPEDIDGDGTISTMDMAIIDNNSSVFVGEMVPW